MTVDDFFGILSYLDENFDVHLMIVRDTNIRYLSVTVVISRYCLKIFFRRTDPERFSIYFFGVLNFNRLKILIFPRQ